MEHLNNWKCPPFFHSRPGLWREARVELCGRGLRCRSWGVAMATVSRILEWGARRMEAYMWSNSYCTSVGHNCCPLCPENVSSKSNYGDLKIIFHFNFQMIACKLSMIYCWVPQDESWALGSLTFIHVGVIFIDGWACMDVTFCRMIHHVFTRH